MTFRVEVTAGAERDADAILDGIRACCPLQGTNLCLSHLLDSGLLKNFDSAF